MTSIRRHRFKNPGPWLFLALLSASCRTTGPVPLAPPVIAASLAEIEPRWTPYAEELAPGLRYFAGRVENPRLEFHALRVDLAEPGLRIVVNGGAPRDGGKPGHVPSTTVSSFVKHYGCVAGINTNPFAPVSGREGEDRSIDGIAVAAGLVLAPPDPAFDALVFYDDAGGLRAAIVSQANLEGEELRNIRHAAGGFHTVLRQGAPAERVARLEQGGKALPRHPRSAAGLSAGGKILYLLVVDGRRPGSVGVTEPELGIILRQLGAADGLNFDGGGSSALVLRDRRGRFAAVNVPIHNRIPGWERAVALCLGIAVAEL